jgi:hypothetical protein
MIRIRQIVIGGLLLVGVVAMMSTEAAAQWRYCFGCGSGDACRLDFQKGGLFTGNDIKNGLIDADCNNRFHGGQVLDAVVACRNQGGTVAPGFPVQGNAEGTFDIQQKVTSADVHGSDVTKQLNVEVTFADFCVNPPTDPTDCSSVCDGSPDACNAFSTTPSCYECFKLFFNLPDESIGCPNATWRYDHIDYDDHCVNFRVIETGVGELISVTRRCTDPGNTNFVECVEDQTTCPFE